MAIDYGKEPWPKTLDELVDYIKELTAEKGDDNKTAQAMSLAAQAAFNYTAGQLDANMAQASWAQMHFIQMQRHLKHGFMILDAGNILNPQYDLVSEIANFIEKMQPQISKAAYEMLQAADESVDKSAKLHWETLSKYYKQHKEEEK